MRVNQGDHFLFMDYQMVVTGAPAPAIVMARTDGLDCLFTASEAKALKYRANGWHTGTEDLPE